MESKKVVTFRLDAAVFEELKKLDNYSSFITDAVMKHYGTCPTCGEPWKKGPDRPSEFPIKKRNRKSAADRIGKFHYSDDLLGDFGPEFAGPSAADLIPPTWDRPVIYELSEEQVKQIEKMASIGMTLEHMAFVLGITPTTFRRRVEEQRVLHEKGDQYKWNLYATIQRGMSSMVMQISHAAFQKGVVEKDAKMLIWLTKVKLGWKEPEEEKKDQAPVVFETQIVNGQIKRGTRELTQKEIDELDGIIDAETQ